MDYLVTGVLQLPHRLAGHRVQVLVWANDSVQLAGIDLDVRTALPGRPGNLSLKFLPEVVHCRHRGPPAGRRSRAVRLAFIPAFLCSAIVELGPWESSQVTDPAPGATISGRLVSGT